MSLANRSIALDQLPDERIFNPLRGRQGTRAARQAPPPQQRAAPEPAPAPRSGLFSRIANPAAQRASSQSLEAPEDGQSSESEDGEQAPASYSRRRQPAEPEQPVASGPFAKVANTNRCCFQFVAGFKDVSGSLSRSSASVTVQFSEVLRHADTPESYARLDPKRTIPIYVRVAGTSMSDEIRRMCTLEVYDAAGKPLFSKFVHKHNNAEGAIASGYPLFLFHAGGQNNIFFHPPELSAEHKTYWTFTMETLEKNTSMFVNPTTGEQFVIIKKDSGCAKLMQYALSERNDIVRNPWLLENPAYQNPNDPDNIRLPVDMYNKVKGAYRKKLGEIQATSFDLSSIKVVLKPLELAKEMHNEQQRSGAVKHAGVPNLDHVWGHVAIEVYAHIPTGDDEETFLGAKPGGAAQQEESDDDDL